MLIAQTPHFQVHRLFAHNPLRNYTYVLVESATRLGWVIDPWDGDALLEWARHRQVVLSGILNTHQHSDHIRGNEVLCQAGIPILTEFESIAHGCGEKQTWHTPGHTMDHVVYWLSDGGESHCFVGDTLFQVGVGNCKHGGDPSRLFHTIQELSRKLAPDCWLHPGHDYLERNGQFALSVEPSNPLLQALVQELAAPPPTYERAPRQWQDEMATNPFLRTAEAELRLATAADNDEMVFKILRRMRDNW